MFSLFNISSIYPGGQLTRFAPMCGRPRTLFSQSTGQKRPTCLRFPAAAVGLTEIAGLDVSNAAMSTPAKSSFNVQSCNFSVSPPSSAETCFPCVDIFQCLANPTCEQANRSVCHCSRAPLLLNTFQPYVQKCFCVFFVPVSFLRFLTLSRFRTSYLVTKKTLA